MNIRQKVFIVFFSASFLSLFLLMVYRTDSRVMSQRVGVDALVLQSLKKDKIAGGPIRAFNETVHNLSPRSAENRPVNDGMRKVRSSLPSDLPGNSLLDHNLPKLLPHENKMNKKRHQDAFEGLKGQIEKAAIIREQCARGVCLSEGLLSRRERTRHDECLLKAAEYVKRQKSLYGQELALSRCSCRLHPAGGNKSKYGRVALVSLPGSGNTWARGLLERATNICTASMWCDPNLRATQFCGEGLHNGRTLLVKNHDPTVRWRGESLPRGSHYSDNNKPEFDAVVFVHRDPYDAMVAEHNREVGYSLWEAALTRNKSTSLSAHVQSFGPEYFGENRAWTDRVIQLMKRWKSMVTHLLIENTKQHPVLVVRYEDLKADTLGEVVRMTSFLGLDNIPRDMLLARVKRDFTRFRRNHTSSFEHFTDAQKHYINGIISLVAARLQPEVIPLRDYMRYATTM